MIDRSFRARVKSGEPLLGAFVNVESPTTVEILAVAGMAAVGWSTERFVLRHVSGQSQVAVVILTIALGFVLRFVAGLIWGHDPLSLENPMTGANVRFSGLVLGLDEVVVIIATTVLTGGLFLFFSRSRLGIAMQAASQNQLAACYMGIPVRHVHGLIWALAGGIAAVAGILFAAKGSIDPSTGLLGIKAFAAAVIGGFGSLPGALAGGLVIGLAEPFAARFVAAGYSQIVPYALLILVLLFRPHGLFSQVMGKKV